MAAARCRLLPHFLGTYAQLLQWTGCWIYACGPEELAQFIRFRLLGGNPGVDANFKRLETFLRSGQSLVRALQIERFDTG
jgi:hypothetical protein